LLALTSCIAWMACLTCIACTACTPDEPEPPPEVPDIEYCEAVRDWEPAWVAFEDEVVVLLNERRAEGAVCIDDMLDPAGPLRMDPALRCAARKHARDMAEQDYFSNVDPDEVDLFMRAELAEYEGMVLDQNIGAAHSTPEQLVTAVMGNTELCIHVMAPEADEIGVGYLEYEGATYPNYWTQVFGQAP
jgi:uncharacterized protein YkwD